MNDSPDSPAFQEVYFSTAEPVGPPLIASSDSPHRGAPPTATHLLFVVPLDLNLRPFPLLSIGETPRAKEGQRRGLPVAC
jgi:hypothetical protein